MSISGKYHPANFRMKLKCILYIVDISQNFYDI